MKCKVQNLVWLVVAISLQACNSFESELLDKISAGAPETVSIHLPVFDITADSLEFANMVDNFKEDIEIDCTISMYRNFETILDNQKAEIQIKGNFSAGFPLKPFGVKLDQTADNINGQLFQVPELIPGHSLSRIKAFRLRNGGNDFTGTMLKDLAYGRVVASSGMNVVAVYGEPAACFVNGEFYGLLNLRSEGNANGISRLLDIDKDDLALAELDEAPQFEVKDGDTQRFRDLEMAIRAGDLPYLKSTINEASFIDFVIIGTTFAAWDWPWKNVRMFSVDGAPFRFVVYDFDLASERYLDEGLVYHMRKREPNLITEAFNVLYADAGFRQNLEQRQREILASRVLHPNRLREAMEELAAVYAPIIDAQTVRWGIPKSKAIWYLKMEEYLEAYEVRYKSL